MNLFLGIIIFTAIAITPSIIARQITAKILGLNADGIYRFLFLYGAISYILLFSFIFIFGEIFLGIPHNLILLYALLLIISMMILEGFILKKKYSSLNMPSYKISFVINSIGVLVLAWLYVIFSGGLF